MWTTGSLVSRFEQVIDLAIRANGNGYVLVNNGSTFRVIAFDDSTGIERWRSEVPYQISIAAAPMGAVLNGPTGVRMLSDVDGSLLWSVPAGSSEGRYLAVSSTGAIAASSYDGTVMRFDALGTRLLPDWTLPGTDSQIIFDPNDRLVALGASVILGSVTRTVTRLDNTGGVSSTATSPAVLPRDQVSGAGIAAASTGSVFTWVGHQYRLHSTYSAGGLIETFDAAGARTWSLDKVGIPDGYGNGDVVVISDAACDLSGHCALFGGWNRYEGWIEVFSVQ